MQALRGMAGAAAGLAGLFGLLIGASAAFAREGAAGPRHCAAGASAIGLARTIEIDATGGPRFGAQYRDQADLLQPGEVVLTFDDGPHPLYTRPILDALEAHCTRATFFIVGQRALPYRGLVREVAARGHTIATHTWSHKKQSTLSPAAAQQEIELGISAVRLALGQGPAPFFRFPYLNDPAHAIAHLRARNTAIFSIDIDSFDFRTRSPTRVISNVLSGLARKGRGIILFHDIQPATAAALPRLLTELKARGYRVVHVVARQPQATLANYDQSILRDYGGARLALAGPPPVSQRGFMHPGWEVQVTPPGPVTALPLGPAAQTARASPRPLPPSPVLRRVQADDWRTSVFRGY